MNNSQNTITTTRKELGVELGISEADFGCKLKIKCKDPVIPQREVESSPKMSRS